MDELVKRTEIVDAQLVKAVTALMPGESIENILDETRIVTLKRVFNSIKSQNFTTVIHLVEELRSEGLTEEATKTVLTWLAQEGGGLGVHAKNLLNSDLTNSIFKFISDLDRQSESSSRRFWCCTRPTTH
jgi:hypothetical protein